MTNGTRLSCEEARDLAPAFVLGALERDDEAAVRAHLASCREAHDEMAELGSVVPYLAETLVPVEPPARLKTAILAAAAAELERTPRDVARRPALAPPLRLDRPADELRQRPQSPPRVVGWALGLAAALAIAVLGGWGLRLQGELADARAFQAAVAEVLSVANEPGSQTAILRAAEPGGPSGLAAVAADGSVVLALHGLKPTAGSEVYEAWMIGSSGTAVAVGGFTVDEGGTARFRTRPGPTQPGVTLALTHEPGPGSTQARGPIVASGVATPAES